MTEPLQEFGWKKSSYDRPNQPWVCGRLCEGDPCRIGPDRHGACRLQTQCVPEKVGEKYRCTRTALHGGKCMEGPSPQGACCQRDESCRPRRSLLRRRRNYGLIAAAAAVVFGFVAFNIPNGQAVILPGDVTSAHASFESNCSACHAAGEGGVLHAAVNGGDESDSNRCLACHDELGSNALFAHAVAPHQLAEQTARVQDGSFDSDPSALQQLVRLAGTAPNHDLRLACATCHREHHGRSYDLQAIADSQCQTCHARQFQDFAHGHPGFGDYPHEQRSGIYFDHASHIEKYFKRDEFERLMPDGRTPDSCTSCHEPDSAGETMLTRGFDLACASCHEAEIVDAGFPGIPFFALPRLPSGSIGNDGDSPGIGEWPSLDSSAAQFPVFMRLLLREDEAFQNASATLAGRDLRQFSVENDEQRTVARDFSIAVKRLLADVRDRGEQALTDRLETPHADLSFIAPLIAPALQEAGLAWFPNLESEVAAMDAGDSLPAPESAPPTVRTSSATARGWYVSRHDGTVRYRPPGHDDMFLRKLLDRLTTAIDEPDRESRDQYKAWRNLFANPSASGDEWSNGPIASGRCLLCHATDRGAADGELRIHWPASRPENDERRITRFRHRPHLLTDGTESCQSCHQLSAIDDETDTYSRHYFQRSDNNRWRLMMNADTCCTSGLAPIERSTCTTCHNPGQTRQSCVSCHNYHVAGHTIR